MIVVEAFDKPLFLLLFSREGMCYGYIVYYEGLVVLTGFYALLTQWFRG